MAVRIQRNLFSLKALAALLMLSHSASVVAMNDESDSSLEGVDFSTHRFSDQDDSDSELGHGPASWHLPTPTRNKQLDRVWSASTLEAYFNPVAERCSAIPQSMRREICRSRQAMLQSTPTPDHSRQKDIHEECPQQSLTPRKRSVVGNSVEISEPVTYTNPKRNSSEMDQGQEYDAHLPNNSLIRKRAGGTIDRDGRQVRRRVLQTPLQHRYVTSD